MSDFNNKDLIGKQIQPIPKEQKEIGIDTNRSFTDDILEAVKSDTLDTAALESFASTAQTREETYKLIDVMAQDDVISSVLETYAEDTVEPNDNGDIIWCESSDEYVSKYVNYILDSLNVNKNAYSWAYNLVKYGDVYLKRYRQSDYGEDLLFGSDGKTIVEEEKNKPLNEDLKLINSTNSDKYVNYVELVSNPGEMFELTRFGKTMGYIQAPVNIQSVTDQMSTLNPYMTYKMQKKDVTIYEAIDYVHACLEDNANRAPEEVDIFLTDDDGNETKNAKYKVKRGQSILANSFKVWRELNLLENSVLLNRLVKSAVVRILSVDAGDMPKDQVQNFLSRLKSLIEQKSALNLGNSLAEYTNPAPVENFIIVPTHGTQGTITSQTIGGDVDPKQLTDVDYFQNKLYGSLRVPKQFFAQTDDSAGFNGGSSLAIISSRYGKAIKRIQTILCQMVTDLVNLVLIDRGLMTYINKFKIRMQAPVTQEELDKRSNLRDRIGVITDTLNQIDGVVTDEVIKAKITKILLAPTINNSEVLNLLQEQIELMEEAKNKAIKTPKSDNNETDEIPNNNEIESENGMESMPRPAFRDVEPETTDSNQEVEPNEGNEEEQNTDRLPSGDELGVDFTNNF